ncbi:hypothetical protein AXG93_1681s1010 [Marchantia polymorpha subsp. ruderalis]|uniref:Integrase catalytic domain-containing protein n=1 Tax=Marchantia polymorpha subsp. ruderalis TaxID=1480154 RepID=A0A176VVA7_MARPO|nr:hypothetical protein AXG93_1681s1010 [Marchantia polymorpha subsp. ruderalis]
MAPYSLLGDVLFKLGADDKMWRCMKPKYRQTVIRSLHDGPQRKSSVPKPLAVNTNSTPCPIQKMRVDFIRPIQPLGSGRHRYIILATDYATKTHFLNDVVSELTGRYGISHRKTAPYNPKANGLTERANGIICNILTKVVTMVTLPFESEIVKVTREEENAYATLFRHPRTGKNGYRIIWYLNWL